MRRKIFSNDELDRLLIHLNYVATTYIGEHRHHTLPLNYHDSQDQEVIMDIFNAMPRYGRQYKVKHSKTTPKKPLVKYFTFYKYHSFLDGDTLEIQLNNETFKIYNIDSKAKD